MPKWCMSFLITFLCFSFLLRGSESASFNDSFQPNWPLDHVLYEGETVKLKLDNTSGGGFASKGSYLFGKIGVRIKLVPGDSAGTATAFYMSSQSRLQDEFNFEFLGNKRGEPYVVETNIYSNGTSGREQRMYLWFDPTRDFHAYSLLWNHHQVVFFVDDVPIRTFPNMEKKGVPYPKSQAMGIFSSIWNADNWATQGGLVKINWTHAPFVTTYRDFEVDACCYSGPRSVAACSSHNGNKWWHSPAYSKLGREQHQKLRWVHQKYVIYDYCKDATRFPKTPVECPRHL